MSAVAYFDSSALIKLVIDEPESDALRAFRRTADATATSILGVVEARRGASRRGDVDAVQLSFVLGSFDLIELDRSIADAAARLAPPSLRTLDAIHLASAGALGSDLEALVTYDRRMIEAARAIGLPVVSPGAAG